jgi:hypothetical protein
MINKRATLHIYDIPFKETSWELKEKLKKYLGGASVEFMDEGCRGFTITSKEEISGNVLFQIETLVPKWAAEIGDADKRKEAEALKEVKHWLASEVLPSPPVAARLVPLYNVIVGLREDLEQGANKGEALPCGLGDLKDLLNLFKLLEKNKMEDAQKACHRMDTGARDYIPDKVYAWIMEEDD